jgi:hypothetical protein
MVGYRELNEIYSDPVPTAERLINVYKIGVCRDYSLATATLLRKAGYGQEDIGNYCDGAHCYVAVRFPGDTKWHVVDTTGNTQDVVIGGLPGGYPYCQNLNESGACYAFIPSPYGYSYTGTIADVDEYWRIVDSGGTYTYPLKYRAGSRETSPCKKTWNFLPQSGPGIAYGRDSFRIPDFAPSISQIIGCS